jgi:uncharacterized phage protein (TIGR01671 family)
MREIKFRAWDNIAGRFKTGTELAETIIRVELDGAIELKGAIYNISEVTLMQYTGLKDKNGVEIYEGDICRFVNIENGDIEVSPIIFERANFTTNWSSQGLGILFSIYDGDIEIIGNIYENPELVEEAK